MAQSLEYHRREPRAVAASRRHWLEYIALGLALGLIVYWGGQALHLAIGALIVHVDGTRSAIYRVLMVGSFATALAATAFVRRPTARMIMPLVVIVAVGMWPYRGTRVWPWWWSVQGCAGLALGGHLMTRRRIRDYHASPGHVLLGGIVLPVLIVATDGTMRIWLGLMPVYLPAGWSPAVSHIRESANLWYNKGTRPAPRPPLGMSIFDDRITLTDANGNQTLVTMPFRVNPDALRVVRLSQDGTWLAVVQPYRVFVYDVAGADGPGSVSLRCVYAPAWATWTNWIRELEVLPDGRTIAAVTNEDGVIHLYDTSTLREIAKSSGTGTGSGSVVTMACSPDGSMLATWSFTLNGGSVIDIWSVPSLARLRSVRCNIVDAAASIGFTGNRRYVVVRPGWRNFILVAPVRPSVLLPFMLLALTMLTAWRLGWREALLWWPKWAMREESEARATGT